MRRSLTSRLLLAAGSVLALGASAYAQTGPPEMPEVVFPIDTDSIVTAVTAAGVVLLLAWFVPSVGFSFVRRLLKRMKKVV